MEKKTEENETFQTVMFTSHYSQLVLMSIKPAEDIGEEVHGLDQFIKLESGSGKDVLDSKEHTLEAGFAVVIPAGTRHNIVNTSQDQPMKLYTVYSPPDHQDKLVRGTKKEAVADDVPFDGYVSASR